MTFGMDKKHLWYNGYEKSINNKKEILEKVFSAPKNLIIEGEIGSGKSGNVLFPLAAIILSYMIGNTFFIGKTEAL